MSPTAKQKPVEQIILGIDPGPTHCGFVVYDSTAQRVIESHKKIEIVEAITGIDIYAGRVDLVAIEMVQSYGIAGASPLQTARSAGRLEQAAQGLRLPTRLIYRREVLRALDVTGKGNRDALVRQRLIEMHGGERTKDARERLVCAVSSWEDVGGELSAAGG